MGTLGAQGTTPRRQKRRQSDAEGIEGWGNGEGVSPSQPTRGSGECRKLLSGVRAEPWPKWDFVKSECQRIHLVAPRISLNFLPQFYTGCTAVQQPSQRGRGSTGTVCPRRKKDWALCAHACPQRTRPRCFVPTTSIVQLEQSVCCGFVSVLGPYEMKQRN